MPGEDCTYKSLLRAIFKGRRLRVESEHNDSGPKGVKAFSPTLMSVTRVRIPLGPPIIQQKALVIDQGFLCGRILFIISVK